MKNILFLFAFISFANIQAQEVNLQAMTREERTRYVSREATRALDENLYDFLKEMKGSTIPRPQYYALAMSYSEYKISSDEAISDFYELYEKFITDYTVRKNDYTYTISFVNNSRFWKPLLYKVTVLNNGKALTMFVIEDNLGRVIYKNNN